MSSASMARVTETITEIDPLTDPRWPAFLQKHAQATIFHSAEWLGALRRTYGYTPVALTTSQPGSDLASALVFCRVDSRITGRRLVSAPFSDYCPPLVNSAAELRRLASRLKTECEHERRDYVELRWPAEHASALESFSQSEHFVLHRLDLRPSLEEIRRGFHASCIGRKIAKAAREHFRYEEGRSECLLNQFYRLAIITRKRQQLPPQPLAWFRTLIRCLGERAKLRLLFHSGRPAAGILTISFGRAVTYKYGFSDRRFQTLGSMQLLLWKTIQEAKNEGMQELDLGRTDLTNQGLLTFKDRWGAKRTELIYLRHPFSKPSQAQRASRSEVARWICAHAPDAVLTAVGRMLYRHMA